MLSNGGPDNNGDNLCDYNPDIWSEPTSRQLGFGIDTAHKFVYSFTQYEVDEVSFAYRARARADFACQGLFSGIVMSGTVQKTPEGSCQIQRAPIMEYQPMWGNIYAGIGITIPAFQATPQAQLFGDLCHDELPEDETFEYLFAEQIDHLEWLLQLMSDHWEVHCSFPELPPKTPDKMSCCDDGQIICGPDEEGWDHPFWSQIGFAIDLPHQSTYEVTAKPAGDTGTMFFVKSRADTNCYWWSNEIERIGIAETPPAGPCSFTIVEGYNT